MDIVDIITIQIRVTLIFTVIVIHIQCFLWKIYQPINQLRMGIITSVVTLKTRRVVIIVNVVSLMFFQVNNFPVGHSMGLVIGSGKTSKSL